MALQVRTADVATYCLFIMVAVIFFYCSGVISMLPRIISLLLNCLKYSILFMLWYTADVFMHYSNCYSMFRYLFLFQRTFRQIGQFHIVLFCVIAVIMNC